MEEFCVVVLALLIVTTLASLLVFNFVKSQPWYRHPLVSFFRNGAFSKESLIKTIHLHGRSIGAFHVDSSLQKDYIITLLVEEDGPEPGSGARRKVLNISFHALQNSPFPTTPIRPEGSPCLCPYFLGRLGNQLFIFSSSFGIAAQRNLSVVVPGKSHLRDLFALNENSLVNVTEDKGVCAKKLVTVNSGVCCKYNPKVLTQVTGTQSVKLTGHLQSYRYFEDVEEALREALILTPEYKDKSSQALLKALKTRYNSSQEWEGRTLVGVHVRRGDFASPEEIKVGRVAAPAEYFTRAMTYFDKHYHNVTYVICSDSLGWVRANVHHNHSVLVESGSALVDFSVLTRLNHTVMSTGTFGWWAAWLVNGTTVYYKDFLKKGTPMFDSYNPKGEDFYPPHWIPL